MADIWCRIAVMDSTGRFTPLSRVHPAIAADRIISEYTREDAEDGQARRYIVLNCDKDGRW